MDLVAAVVADEQALELVQPGEGAFDDPAVATEAGAVAGTAAGDLRGDAAAAEFAAVAGRVVAAVSSQPVGPPARPADFAADGRDTVEQRDQLGDVVAVTAGNRERERDPGGIDQEVVL